MKFLLPSITTVVMVMMVGMIPGLNGTEEKATHITGQDAQDTLPSSPRRLTKRHFFPPLRAPVSLQEDPHLQPGMDSWIENSAIMQSRPYQLADESGFHFNPDLGEAQHVLGYPFGNPYSHAGLVDQQNGRLQEEISHHPSKPLHDPFGEEFIIHSHETPKVYDNPYGQGKLAMLSHRDPPPHTKPIMIPSYLRRPAVTSEVARGFKHLGALQTANPNIPSRTLPRRWNKLVINSLIKFKFGGDDVFDVSEFSWIPGLQSLSPSKFEDMIRWDQLDGTSIFVPKILKDLNLPVTQFPGQDKWQFPDEGLHDFTVPLSIVKLVRDFLEASPLQLDRVRLEPEDGVWYDANHPQDSQEASKLVHLLNRHAVDFRDYHDYAISPNKELPQKDPVMLGLVET